MKRIAIVSVLVAVLFSGCAIFRPYANLSPLDQAKVAVETLSSWYDSTHDALEIRWANADEVEREFLRREINPKMNKLLPLITKHNDLILLWEETNTKPSNYEEMLNEIQRLILGVINVLD